MDGLTDKQTERPTRQGVDSRARDKQPPTFQMGQQVHALQAPACLNCEYSLAIFHHRIKIRISIRIRIIIRIRVRNRIRIRIRIRMRMRKRMRMRIRIRIRHSSKATFSVKLIKLSYIITYHISFESIS